jgi:hypothetical protein
MAKVAQVAITTLHRKPSPASSHLKGLKSHDAGIRLRPEMREAWAGRILSAA